MGRLFVLFFLLPWWAYIPASAGVLWLGERVYEQALETEAEKVAALEQGLPEAVDLGAFDRTNDRHAANEVNVYGWFDPELNYELVKRRNGVPTDTRYLYMMFGTADPKGAREVRAALMLTKKERERFIDTIDEYLVGLTDSGEFLYAFNGFGDTSATLGDMASDAFKEQGLAKSADFIFIEPFFEGREAALAPHGVPEKSRQIGWLIAAAVALIGVVKRVMVVRARPNRDEADALAAAQAPEPSAAGAPAAPAFTLPSGVSDDSPLGRLARKNAQMSPANLRVPEAYSGSSIEQTRAALAATDNAADMPAPTIHNAPVYDSGTPREEVETALPPVPEDMPAQAHARASSSSSFYAKLVLAMLVVGGISYNPSLLNAAFPFALVALFWFGVYVLFRKVRSGGKTLFGAAIPTPSHRRRPDGAGQAVATGVGGRKVDLGAPVRGNRRGERGVI